MRQQIFIDRLPWENAMEAILDPSILLHESEAARMLRISIDTIRRERRAGRISYIKIRGKIFYTKEQLSTYLANQTVNPINGKSRRGSRNIENAVPQNERKLMPESKRKFDANLAFLIAQRTLKGRHD